MRKYGWIADLPDVRDYFYTLQPVPILTRVDLSATGFVPPSSQSTGHIVRLHGAPTSATGQFLDTLRATEGFDAKLGLLNRSQGWVVKKLREALSKIDDPMLYADLREILEAHEANIAACERALA